VSIGSEFKEFAMKGNVIDLAVGVIIGAAFGVACVNWRFQAKETSNPAE